MNATQIPLAIVPFREEGGLKQPLTAVIAAAAPVGPLSTVAMAKVEQPQPPKEFVPVDTIPAEEQIPAINLVAAQAEMEHAVLVSVQVH